MIHPQQIIAHCCAKNKAYVDYPFGEEPVCVKVNGRIFAQLYPREENYKITLKCEPLRADDYRRRYPGVVVRGYHCPPSHQPYWNTIWLSGIKEPLLLVMIDHSYAQVIKSFSKKVQADILRTDAD